MENMVKLPKKYDLVQGDPFELFYKGVLLCKNPYHYYIKAESTIKGHAFERGIYCENHLPGRYDLKLTVRNDAGDIVGQGTTKLVVKEKMKNPKEPCYVLCMGASQTAGGTWPERFKGKLGELSNVVFVGKKQTEAGVHFEGEGGWTFDNYTNPHALHQFWVRTGLNHGKDTEDQESVYRDELGQLWRLETIDYWRLKFRRCGGETEVLPPQGKLFWEEGGKNKNTIVYDQVCAEASSPFVYDGKVDFATYCRELGIPRVDRFYVLLGMNNSYDTEEEYKPKARKFIDAVLAAFPEAKVVLMGEVLPSLDGCGMNYGIHDHFCDFRGLQEFVFSLNRWYEELAEEYGESVEHINLSGQFDTEHCFPEREARYNIHDETTYMRQCNGLHPRKAGYYQIADAAFRHFNNDNAWD